MKGGNSQTKLLEKWFVTMLSFSVFYRSIQSDSFSCDGNFVNYFLTVRTQFMLF